MVSAGGSKLKRIAGLCLPLFLAYLLLLQGLATAYAQTLMKTNQLDPAFVICAPSGQTDQLPDDPLEQVSKNCCNALCEAALSVGPSVQSPTAEIEWIFPDEAAAYLIPHPSQTAPPGQPELLPQVRAPPFFSI